MSHVNPCEFPNPQIPHSNTQCTSFPPLDFFLLPAAAPPSSSSARFAFFFPFFFPPASAPSSLSSSASDSEPAETLLDFFPLFFFVTCVCRCVGVGVCWCVVAFESARMRTKSD